MDTHNNINDFFSEDHNQYKKIFEGNQEWVQERLHEDTHYFSKLSKGQTPKYLIIGCSDSRVPPNDLTKLKPGDIFNHRNIANQVLPADMNVNSVIQYAVEHLKVKHIVVMGHTHCGGIKAAIDGNSYGGMLDIWLSHVKNVYNKYQDDLDDIEDPGKKVTRLAELNVVEQVMNVWKNPYVQKAWKRGHPVWVHGWLFKVETGQLEEIIVDTHMPAFLKVFQFKFEELGQGMRKSVFQTHGPVHPEQFTRRVDSPEKRRTSIWTFDNFLSVQNDLMLKPDIPEESEEHEQMQEIFKIIRTESIISGASPNK